MYQEAQDHRLPQQTITNPTFPGAAISKAPEPQPSLENEVAMLADAVTRIDTEVAMLEKELVSVLRGHSLPEQVAPPLGMAEPVLPDALDRVRQNQKALHRTSEIVCSIRNRLAL